MKIPRSVLAPALAALAFLTALPAFAATPKTNFKFSFGPAAPAAGATQILPTTAYTKELGYGFESGTVPVAVGDHALGANAPFYFSVAEPEGNYKVTVTFGSDQAASDNTVKAELRRLMLEKIHTAAGQSVTRSFIVNVRIPQYPGGEVRLKDREKQGEGRAWDDKLTLEFNGRHPRIAAISIVPSEGPTVFITGDSTVTDQRFEPGASWGQMLPRFLPGIAVANHAESGETLKSFITGLRLAKVLSQLKAGDYLLMQFGHNDEKRSWPQTYVEAMTTYKAYLRVFIAEARLRGATPVLISPVQRRTFDANGKIRNSHGQYPEAVRQLAAEEQVPFIDLSSLSSAVYEALGTVKAPLAFSGFGARRDATHHDNFGAYEMATCVTQGLRDAGLPQARDIAPDFTGFDPHHPDSPDTFAVPASPLRSNLAPRGS